MKKIIIISGPTSTGKTSLSIELAKKHQAEIINFDSLLFYKEMDIGTAKPSLEELDSVPHHFVSFRSPNQPLNAYDYMIQAVKKINEIHSNNKLVILVGGSGFYLQAILQGMYDANKSDPEIIKKSNSLYEKNGIDPFIEILKHEDPESYQRYHLNDHYRIRRAVEYFWQTGAKFSEAREKKDHENKNKSNWNSSKYQWDCLHVYLDLPKSEHLEIIHQRTNKMINSGLFQEVEKLLLKYPEIPKPLKSIGYKESIKYLNNEFTKDECVERINISTRQLAKAQRTWFNKIEKKSFNSISEKDEIFKSVEEFLLA